MDWMALGSGPCGDAPPGVRAQPLNSGEKLFFGRGNYFTFPDIHPNGWTVRKPRGTPVVVEPDAFVGELVDPRRWGVPAVAGEVTPADVVAQDEYDVRLLTGHV